MEKPALSGLFSHKAQAPNTCGGHLLLALAEQGMPLSPTLLFIEMD